MFNLISLIYTYISYSPNPCSRPVSLNTSPKHAVKPSRPTSTEIAGNVSYNSLVLAEYVSVLAEYVTVLTEYVSVLTKSV